MCLAGRTSSPQWSKWVALRTSIYHSDFSMQNILDFSVCKAPFKVLYHLATPIDLVYGESRKTTSFISNYTAIAIFNSNAQPLTRLLPLIDFKTLFKEIKTFSAITSDCRLCSTLKIPSLARMIRHLINNMPLTPNCWIYSFNLRTLKKLPLFIQMTLCVSLAGLEIQFLLTRGLVVQVARSHVDRDVYILFIWGAR